MVSDPETGKPGLSALAEVGVDGVVVLGTADTAVVERWGRVLEEIFPDDDRSAAPRSGT
jgi:hypothetical protein